MNKEVIRRGKIVNYGGKVNDSYFSDLSRYLKEREYEMCKSLSLCLIVGRKFYLFLRLLKSVGDGDYVTRFGDGRFEEIKSWED